MMDCVGNIRDSPDRNPACQAQRVIRFGSGEPNLGRILAQKASPFFALGPSCLSQDSRFDQKLWVDLLPMRASTLMSDVYPRQRRQVGTSTRHARSTNSAHAHSWTTAWAGNCSRDTAKLIRRTAG